MVTQYYTAASVDGFIADADNSLEWLFPNDIDPAGPMAYTEFITDVGALAMGATTYQWLLDHATTSGLSEPFYEQPMWVFSHRTFPEATGDVRFVSGQVAEIHDAMSAAAGDRNIWIVGGGDLVGQFADAGLLDEIWVQYAPVTLGAGAPLLPRALDLTVIDVARNRDFCCARYAVGRMGESST